MLELRTDGDECSKELNAWIDNCIRRGVIQYSSVLDVWFIVDVNEYLYGDNK